MAVPEKKSKKDKSFDAAIERATGEKPKKIKLPKLKKADREYLGIRFCSKKYRKAVDALCQYLRWLSKSDRETVVSFSGEQYKAKTPHAKATTQFNLYAISFSRQESGSKSGCVYMDGLPGTGGLLRRCEVYLAAYLAKPFNGQTDATYDEKKEATETLAAEWKHRLKQETPPQPAVPFVIPAEAHSDDQTIRVHFDAVEWFEAATPHEISMLAEENWGQGYAADAVAQYFDVDKHPVTRIFAYLALIADDWSKKDVSGFSCSVDEEAATKWLKKNRPAEYAEVTRTC